MNEMTLPRDAADPGRPLRHADRFGPELLAGGVRFRLWAPKLDVVALRIAGEEDRPMARLPGGWFERVVEGAGAGTRYGFVLPDGTVAPDPASRFQPDDVHGLSEVIDARTFGWTDREWHGRPWEETILYELHVGTFTAEGTFRAAIERLDALVDLGVTSIELMPLADFAGRWNWGYDGVLMFAPDSTYGRPEDLRALIDAAHARNLTVFLDVVYNHFGPSGNYMSGYAPQLTDRHDTPWGNAVNLDGDGSDAIRAYFIENVRYWLDVYGFDGLRFDAVHELYDDSSTHFLRELAETVGADGRNRHVHLVLENCANEAQWLRRLDWGADFYTAQWSDDIHHALHSRATGENITYYGDYAGRLDFIARALAEGYCYQGEKLLRSGEPRGRPSTHLPPTAFVSFVQNHDHVGNRPYGERLQRLAAPEAVRALAAINLLSPHIPLLFMGEEWASDRPFLFFSDVGEELAESTRAGQQEQNKAFPLDPQNPPLDPMSREAFLASRLDWEARDSGVHAEWLDFYQRLIAARRREIIPRLPGVPAGDATWEVVGDRGIRVSWRLGDGSRLTMLANLSGDAIHELDPWQGRLIWLEGAASGDTLEPWAVVVSIDEEGTSTP